MSNKISVITVVYNDVANIRQTMESFFAQTWNAKEYIVVDGGSTDGTADIIKEYADRLAYYSKENECCCRLCDKSCAEFIIGNLYVNKKKTRSHQYTLKVLPPNSMWQDIRSA